MIQADMERNTYKGKGTWNPLNTIIKKKQINKSYFHKKKKEKACGKSMSLPI
jgi:hypothetical protein